MHFLCIWNGCFYCVSLWKCCRSNLNFFTCRKSWENLCQLYFLTFFRPLKTKKNIFIFFNQWISTRCIPCPTCTKFFERFLLLVADLVFFAPTFDLWLFFVIFADIVLMLGEKSGKPALLSLWLVIFFINIVGLFLMWVALGLSIYLVRT